MNSKIFQKVFIIFVFINVYAVNNICNFAHAYLTPIVPDDLSEKDCYGNSVSIYGDFAIVGSYSDDEQLIADCGSAYIYQKKGTNWVNIQKLSSNELRSNFGTTVAISERFAFISSSKQSVYIYKRNENLWEFHSKLSINESYSSFGCSLSVFEDYIFIGDKDDDDIASNGGAVYIYYYNPNSDEWLFYQKLNPNKKISNFRFGKQISAYHDFAFIAADESVYIFKKNESTESETWEQVSILLADTENSLNFGVSVSISDEYAIVGANRENEEGSVYIYKKESENWVFNSKLKPDYSVENGNFGTSVSISNNYLVVGCGTYSNPSAYIFFNNEGVWTQEKKYKDNDNSYFGKVVSIYNDYAIIATHESDHAGYNSGYAAICTVKYYSISGYLKDQNNKPIDHAYIKFTNNAGYTYTDETGYYLKKIHKEWSGTLYIEKEDYITTPSPRSYTTLNDDISDQNYELKIFNLSGKILDSDGNPIDNVRVSFSNFGGTLTTDELGCYTNNIYHGWKGKVTVNKSGYKFEPESKEYDKVSSHLYDQDYILPVYTISGYLVDSENTPVTEISIIFDNIDTVYSDDNGYYECKVYNGWTGKSKANKYNYIFNPLTRVYVDINTNYSNQNFIIQLFTISGFIKDVEEEPVGNVKIFFSNNIHTYSLPNGFFTYNVYHGWSGRLQASLVGLKFSPLYRFIENVTKNYLQEDFMAYNDPNHTNVNYPDYDNDGIPNTNDECPDTFEGDATNSNGCKAIKLYEILDNFDIGGDRIKGLPEAIDSLKSVSGIK